MKNYSRSLCSTCIHLANCALTTNKCLISSCSEYMHRLEKESTLYTERTALLSNSFIEKDKKLVLNTSR